MKSENLNSKYHLVFLLGTASLVFGLISIGFGILFLLVVIIGVGDGTLTDGVYVGLVFVITAFAIGGLLLRKYDNDRKKE